LFTIFFESLTNYKTIVFNKTISFNTNQTKKPKRACDKTTLFNSQCVLPEQQKHERNLKSTPIVEPLTAGALNALLLLVAHDERHARHYRDDYRAEE
jgi:hypothetical protein